MASERDAARAEGVSEYARKARETRQEASAHYVQVSHVRFVVLPEDKRALHHVLDHLIRPYVTIQLQGSPNKEGAWAWQADTSGGGVRR